MASRRSPRPDERSPRKRSSEYRQHSAKPGLRVRPQASAWQRAAALLVVHQQPWRRRDCVRRRAAARPMGTPTDQPCNRDRTGIWSRRSRSRNARGKENRRGASTARRSHPRAEPPVRRRRQDTCRASPSESLDRDDQALPWPLHLPAERPSRSNRPRGGTRARRRRVVVRMDHEGRTLARPAH